MSHRQILVTEQDRVTIEKRIGLLTGGVNQDSWESVRHLHDELDGATVIGDSQMPDDVITMNSSVVLLDLDTGSERLCTLVYPGYFSGAPDRVSVLPPLGTALLGARIGTEIEYESSSKGRRRVQVMDIVYQPGTASKAV
jgi:regulator of nucleoside diphosphate kinase